MFWPCSDTVFTQQCVPDCNCEKDLLRMTLNYKEKCPDCLKHEAGQPQHNLDGGNNLLFTREQHDYHALSWAGNSEFTGDWLRRLADFQKAAEGILAIGPDYQIETSALRSGASGMTTWTNRTVPMDTQPNDFLVDHCHFLSPDVKVVPPGTIPASEDKCLLCWDPSLIQRMRALEKVFVSCHAVIFLGGSALSASLRNKKGERISVRTASKDFWLYKCVDTRRTHMSWRVWTVLKPTMGYLGI